jgi:hypothetical protein
LLQSEYGWTHEYILWHVTPAQALVWADCIRRRRALRLAEDAELAYIAAAATQGGKKAFQALRSAVRRLRREAGVVKPVEPEEVARSLGLTDRRRSKSERP